jgi:hypothetical protein
MSRTVVACGLFPLRAARRQCSRSHIGVSSMVAQIEFRHVIPEILQEQNMACFLIAVTRGLVM